MDAKFLYLLQAVKYDSDLGHSSMLRSKKGEIYKAARPSSFRVELLSKTRQYVIGE